MFTPDQLAVLLLTHVCAIIVGGVAGAAVNHWMTRKLAFVVLWLCCASVAVAQTPLLDVKCAFADAMTVQDSSRPHSRYLSMSYLPEAKDRRECYVAVSYTANHLSRVREIYRPVLVNPYLIRLDVLQLCPDAKSVEEWEQAWSKLSESDPYFHLTTLVIKPGGTKPEKVTIAGGWTGLATEAQLRAATYTPQNGAILRADWFVAHATLPPIYYDFAGIPDTEDEFIKTLGVSKATIADKQADLGANLMLSAFTLKPRRVVWLQGPLGGVYQTLDVAQVTADRDPFRYSVSTKDSAQKFDASEWFAVGPNGFFRLNITNAAGKRLNAVDAPIAVDTEAVADGSPDNSVTTQSCIICHVENGLRPLHDQEALLIRAKRGHVKIESNDPFVIKRELGFYDDPRLQRQMEFDRGTYAQAVERACGCKVDDAIAAFRHVVQHARYEVVSIGTVCQELHVPSPDLEDVIDGTGDKILAAILELQSVGRGQWEASYAEAALKSANYHARWKR